MDCVGGICGESTRRNSTSCIDHQSDKYYQEVPNPCVASCTYKTKCDYGN